MGLRNQVLSSVTVGLLVLSSGATPSMAEPASGKQTIGLVLTRMEPAIYQTADAKECPDGMAPVNIANWKKQFPTQQEQEDFEKTNIIHGVREPGGQNPTSFLQLRGPGGAHTGYNPALVKDQIPLPLVQGKTAMGLNLDGKVGPNDFTSPDGESGIDNQMYRLFGCMPSWRKGGFNIPYHEHEFVTDPRNRILIEITNIHNELNDDHVDVTIYKGTDRLVTDSALKAVPGMTQHSDGRERYTARTHGKIVNGILTTDPVDWKFTSFSVISTSERFIRGTQLKIKLTPGGAEGLIGGYEDLEMWYRAYAKALTNLSDTMSMWSPPGFYEAATHVADGYPDETGKFTAISTAYEISATRAYVVKKATPPAEEKLAANDSVHH